MKIAELLNESYDDFDDEMEEPVVDPDEEKVPNLILQIKKSMDTGGNRPITFRDGTKERISLNNMVEFLNRYDTLKPMDREEMQNLAIKSKDMFMQVLGGFNKPRAPKSIY